MSKRERELLELERHLRHLLLHTQYGKSSSVDGLKVKAIIDNCVTKRKIEQSKKSARLNKRKRLTLEDADWCAKKEKCELEEAQDLVREFMYKLNQIW